MESTIASGFGIDLSGLAEFSQPVASSYSPPVKFNGEIDMVTVDIK